MSFLLFISSGNDVTLKPEYDYVDPIIKQEVQHRGEAGNLYQYKWGSYQEFKFSIKYVNSSDRAIVNSWWASNAQLSWQPETGGTIYSVKLLNGSQPINSRVMPYDDQFAGVIMLGTY